MREALEYAFAWTLLRLMGALPRGMARSAGAGLGAVAWWVLPHLKRTGMRNLELAYPEMPAAERATILRRVYRHLGWQLGEFCHMSRYTRENTRDLIRYEGLEHYLAAQERGRGVLIVTGHLGAWELSSFWHSLMGHCLLYTSASSPPAVPGRNRPCAEPDCRAGSEFRSPADPPAGCRVAGSPSPLSLIHI